MKENISNSALSFLVAIGLISMTNSAFAQDKFEYAKTENVSSENRLWKHHENYLEFAKKNLPGYRIQIFFGSGPRSRESAVQAKADFLEAKIDLPIYQDYDSPNFRVRAGNFRNRLEAQKWLVTIREKFPSAFVVSSVIEQPELK